MNKQCLRMIFTAFLECQHTVRNVSYCKSCLTDEAEIG